MTTKPTTVAHDLPPQLHRLTQRLKAWRSKRRPGQRIPEALWKAAGGLARLHGLNPTAKLSSAGSADGVAEEGRGPLSSVWLS